MVHEGDKSHYVYVKDFNRLMFNVNKHEGKKMVLYEMFAALW